MSQCDHCGKSVEHPFQCNRCGGTHCPDHRLPEKHECPLPAGVENIKSKLEKKDKTPEAMTVDRSATGSGGDSTPDVALDGSLEINEVGEDDDSRVGTREELTDGRIFSLTTSTLALRTKNKLRTVLALTGLALVVLGGYNLLLAPFVDIGYIAELHFIDAPLVATEGRSQAGRVTTFFFLDDVLVITAGSIITWFS